MTQHTDALQGASSRTSVASFASNREAERAVDRLSDDGFPVEKTAIVGHGLRYIEQVTGRFGARQAAVSGAASGAFIGGLLGWFFGLLDWSDPLISGFLLALYGLLIGAAIGALIGWLVHGSTGGRRDFGSLSGMTADRYELLVDPDVADRARQLLDVAPAADGPTPLR